MQIYALEEIFKQLFRRYKTMSNYDNGYDVATRDYENQTPYDNDYEGQPFENEIAEMSEKVEVDT